MENKFKDRDISFETLEKAVNGDYFAMQEVIRLFKPYMARLSIEEGRFNRELYERLLAEGGVCSEYPPGVGPRAVLFRRGTALSAACVTVSW